MKMNSATPYLTSRSTMITSIRCAYFLLSHLYNGLVATLMDRLLLQAHSIIQTVHVTPSQIPEHTLPVLWLCYPSFTGCTPRTGDNG